MNKIGLIIRREYMTRVLTRRFILTTLLMPLGIALFSVVAGLIVSYESNEATRILIVDEANMLKRALKDDTYTYFTFGDTSLTLAKERFDDTRFDGILHIPPLQSLTAAKENIYYYSDKKLSLETSANIEKLIAEAIRNYKIEAQGLDKTMLESLKTTVNLDPEPLKDGTADQSSLRAVIAAGIGGFMGVVMYMVVFIYGTMVMRSVMEEKVSRVVEVIISSVRPFELMLGKIIGVGAVGLTQIAIWALLIPLTVTVTSLLFGTSPNEMQSLPNAAELSAAGIDPATLTNKFAQVLSEVKSQNWWLIIPSFLIYFVGGYVLYASLFAAVGSAVGDDLGESQALTLPISLPVILAFYIMFVAVRAPNSTLAVWASIFPLFSPIVMPARLAFEPPMWQLLLSLVILLATALGTVWLSGRIYRVGILLYGKRIKFRELAKWLFYKV